jgi:hypothetical protein
MPFHSNMVSLHKDYHAITITNTPREKVISLCEKHISKQSFYINQVCGGNGWTLMICDNGNCKLLIQDPQDAIFLKLLIGS